MAAAVRIADRPGDLGGVVALHGRLYADEYGLDGRMEGYVAAGLGAWTTEPPAGPGRLWVADAGDGTVIGAIGVTGRSPTACELRWFVVDGAWRGRHLGATLFAEALAFARGAGYERMVLETFSELEDARRMYRAAGFVRVGAEVSDRWGREIELERYELAL